MKGKPLLETVLHNIEQLHKAKRSGTKHLSFKRQRTFKESDCHFNGKNKSDSI